MAPSEWTVCACRSPASHVRPGAAGSDRRPGRSPGAGAAPPAPAVNHHPVRRHPVTDTPSTTTPSAASASATRRAQPAPPITSAVTSYRTPSAGTLYSPIATCHSPATTSPARYPGVAPSGEITNDDRAPPDQPPNPSGPKHPRSRIAPPSRA